MSAPIRAIYNRHSSMAHIFIIVDMCVLGIMSVTSYKKAFQSTYRQCIWAVRVFLMLSYCLYVYGSGTISTVSQLLHFHFEIYNWRFYSRSLYFCAVYNGMSVYRCESNDKLLSVILTRKSQQQPAIAEWTATLYFKEIQRYIGRTRFRKRTG